MTCIQNLTIDSIDNHTAMIHTCRNTTHTPSPARSNTCTRTTCP